MSARPKSTGIDASIEALTRALSLSDYMTIEAANAAGYVTVAQYIEQSKIKMAHAHVGRCLVELYRAGKAERVRVGNAYAYRLK